MKIGPSFSQFPHILNITQEKPKKQDYDPYAVDVQIAQVNPAVDHSDDDIAECNQTGTYGNSCGATCEATCAACGATWACGGTGTYGGSCQCR